MIEQLALMRQTLQRIGNMERLLRRGGAMPEDLQELEEGIEQCVDMANGALEIAGEMHDPDDVFVADKIEAMAAQFLPGIYERIVTSKHPLTVPLQTSETGWRQAAKRVAAVEALDLASALHAVWFERFGKTEHDDGNQG